MTAKEVKPAPLPVPAQAMKTIPVCEVSELPDGSLLVSVRVDVGVANRLKRRANGMPLERYLWESILHRALVDSVY